MTRCRRCTADIFFAQTATGKKIPMDARPVPGMFRVFRGGAGERTVEAVKVYRSHFATCPDADHFRAGENTDTGGTA